VSTDTIFKTCALVTENYWDISEGFLDQGAYA